LKLPIRALLLLSLLPLKLLLLGLGWRAEGEARGRPSVHR
jgi:hypothetical protein